MLHGLWRNLSIIPLLALFLLRPVLAIQSEPCGQKECFKAGVYHYDPKDHGVSLVAEGDLRNDLAQASLGQTWTARPPLNLVITAEYSRITLKYGERGIRYAMIEAGHMGQNIFLQAEARGWARGSWGPLMIARSCESSKSLNRTSRSSSCRLGTSGFKLGGVESVGFISSRTGIVYEWIYLARFGLGEMIPNRHEQARRSA